MQQHNFWWGNQYTSLFTKLVYQRIKENFPKWFPFLVENHLPYTSTIVNISVLQLEGPIKKLCKILLY